MEERKRYNQLESERQAEDNLKAPEKAEIGSLAGESPGSFHKSTSEDFQKIRQESFKRIRLVSGLCHFLMFLESVQKKADGETETAEPQKNNYRGFLNFC